MMCGNDFLEATHLCSFPLCFLLIKPFKVICMVPCKINKVRSQQSLLSCWRQAQATLITSLLCASVSLQHHKYMQTKCRCFHQNISLHIYTFLWAIQIFFFFFKSLLLFAKKLLAKSFQGHYVGTVIGKIWNYRRDTMQLFFSFFVVEIIHV